MSEKTELDAAVDEFAAAMKLRLQSKRKQGWMGWDVMGRGELNGRFLINAAAGAHSGNKKSLVDTANLAMMIWRTER